MIKTVGCATTQHKIEELINLAKQEIEKLSQQPSLFENETDANVDKVFAALHNANIQTVGPEIIFGRIYDYIGFGVINEPMFRHLVLSRIAFPLSKLKTVDYLYRYQGKTLDIDAVYRFLDKLNNRLKPEVEQIAFAHTQKVLNGNISVVFYDMTTLYFEASDEDDLRKTGFSKDGKHQCPQIYIGLLVGLSGYAIGYDIFEGNAYEGHTLIPFLEKMSRKFNLDKPVVIADSGLLSKSNLTALEENGYEYILGARIKNEKESLKSQILAADLSEGKKCSFPKGPMQRLIVNHSKVRARKDAYNRSRGLKRLENKIKKVV
ncbi:MAG: IS1634 family transposase [Marinilabilia sp.]